MKRGKKLYFHERTTEWIKQGKRKTVADIERRQTVTYPAGKTVKHRGEKKRGKEMGSQTIRLSLDVFPRHQ